MAKKSTTTGKVINRRARFDYELGDSLIVGLSLTGAETKALRHGHGQLRGAYVTLSNGELWLVNAQIMPSTGIDIAADEQTRSRKLLAKKREIDQLGASRQAGNTIVPLELITKGRYIKLKIAIGRGKKNYDKRETLKRKQQEREINRVAKL